MELIQTIAVFLLVLLILVSIHEWGHFIVARFCGVKVLRFSVGFGKPFFSFYDKHGTEFALAPIPLGGYVKMLDETAENLSLEEQDKTFESRNTWQQIAILAAGPAANFILAALLFWWLALQEVTMPSPVIGAVEENSPAAYAGIEKGQQIIAIDHYPTPGRMDVYERLNYRLGETGSIHVTVRYPDSVELIYDMELVVTDWLKGIEAPDPLAGLGLSFYRPALLMKVGGVTPGSPAENAGLKAGDIVRSADQIEYSDWLAWTNYIQQHANKNIQLSVERDGIAHQLTVTPAAHKDENGLLVGRIGVYGTQEKWPAAMLIKRQLTFAPAFKEAIGQTWSNTKMVLVSIKKLFVGEISIKNLSGPIGIAKVAGDSARAGFTYYLSFMAILSVYLGVFNLLPIPILDGGRIVFCVAEGLRGKPLSERVKLFSLQCGLMMMAFMMVMAVYNDILRVF
ncbi:MAG: RIP metalloprotease RseP [Marinagarivorans sp.]|nr:RIP metalloprotease RseP [Marinagarivorans sp.]